MRIIKIVFIIGVFVFNSLVAQEVDSTQIYIENFEKSLDYQYGSIRLESGNAKLRVPDGYKYLGIEQSKYVLTDLWGNPPSVSDGILGILVPEKQKMLDGGGYIFTISFDEMGYVEDADADEIDYGELFEELKDDFKNESIDRIEQGYEPIEFIGWASKPHYDRNKKVLHWAKELKFGDATINTLNYNLRILGRKGVYEFNAISDISELEYVNDNVDKIIDCLEFNEGYSYSDFDSETDHIAEWTIGGLVAGKILAKVGAFAFLAKFGKIIALAIFAFFGGIWKKFKN